MENEYELKLRNEFNRLARYFNNDDNDRYILTEWRKIFREHKNNLSESFIREFTHYLDPSDLFSWSTANKDFVREFDQTFYFLMECFMREKLDENFIKEFGRPTLLPQDKVPINDKYMMEDIENAFWRQIAKNQKMSEEFIERFYEKIDWEEIHYNVACHTSYCGEEWLNNFKKFQKVIARKQYE